MTSRNADLVQAILHARQSTGVLIFITPPSLKPSKRQVIIQGELLPPPMPPSTVPLANPELEGLLMHLLPRILTGLEQARSASGPKLSMTEALSFPTTVIALISLAVHRGAPEVRGRNARTLVTLIFRVMYGRYVVPTLPLWLRPIAPLLMSSAVAGLEGHYRGLIQGGDDR
ncbi:hypothetical protein [Deinococcus hopiensis]|uniref:Uncharacterized protein n=1 Tax=Deinococcus hopiensis KR-140 TaxID=695939 RepID=A0A1W1ULU6_9DEIO|nr:hypothetical protein [Deinococcus hopiensis]SMB81969.1 hypothetical protein SAMN00790413_04793 [Deinococcus hopiensis KR-140]